jgi:poly-gamma-glutamate synthesis protein (capsule biosynthesis protein)
MIALVLAAVLAGLEALPNLTGLAEVHGAGSVHAAPGPIATRAAAGKPGVLTLSFVGDVLLGGSVGDLIDAEGPLAPWQGVKDLLSAADLTCGNLECAVGTTGTAVPGKTWTFRAAPKSLEGLIAAGFDVVSLANNHALDYGTECLLEGVRLLKDARVEPVGAGANDQAARKPFIFDKNGLKVGILATTIVWPDSSWVASRDSPGLAADGWNCPSPWTWS